MFLLLVSILLILLVFVTFSIKVYTKFQHGICKSGVHMIGKVVIVTGGNSGIGFETAKNLAERGAHVILACRDTQRAEEAVKKIINISGNKNVEYRHLDLASFNSVRQFSADILKTVKRLDVLVNNAGAGGMGNIKSEDGNQIGIQVNYFSTFLLTNLLLPLLKSSAPSRIVNVSSIMYKYGELNFDNLNMEKNWNDFSVYANSKLYMNLMTIELSRRLKGSNVTVNCLHPGIAATNIFRNIKTNIIRNIVKAMVSYTFLSDWEAAQTSIYVAVSPELQNITGKYFSNCREEKLTDFSQNPEDAEKLWRESEKCCKL